MVSADERTMGVSSVNELKIDREERGKTGSHGKLRKHGEDCSVLWVLFLSFNLLGFFSESRKWRKEK